MGNINIPATPIGHAAGKSGQEIGLQNELTILDRIQMQGWVREKELSLLTGLSPYTVGQVCRRLAKRKQIYREREHGNAGYFLRLQEAGAKRVHGKSGKDITIPACWPHHALAIQVMHALSQQLGCDYQTEASLRHQLRSGKIPDGCLISENEIYYFEQELSRKSGPALRKQTDEIIRQAQLGTICFIAYPYPAAMCGGIDHEVRLTNAIRHKWGSPAAPNIRLVRCYFDSLIDYQNMHVGQVEVITLPTLFNTSAANKVAHIDQVKGFQWKINEVGQRGQPREVKGELWHDGVHHRTYVFTEGTEADDHWVMDEYSENIARGDPDLQTFEEFMLEQKAKIVEQFENFWMEIPLQDNF